MSAPVVSTPVSTPMDLWADRWAARKPEPEEVSDVTYIDAKSKLDFEIKYFSQKFRGMQIEVFVNGKKPQMFLHDAYYWKSKVFHGKNQVCISFEVTGISWLLHTYVERGQFCCVLKTGAFCISFNF